MEPTEQNDAAADDEKPRLPVEKTWDLLCNVKYTNTLPDVPSNLKFLKIPFNPTRFVQYQTTSLEKSYKFETHVDRDLGLNIDLVDKDKYSIDHNDQMDSADEKLFGENDSVLQNPIRSRHHAKNVSWLRRTEYISTEKTRFQPHSIDKVEAKLGFNINKNFKDDTLYTDRDSQMKAIEKTFEDNKKPVEKHYSKPNVYAVETLNILPDFKNWRYPCAQVIFDSNPAPVDRPIPVQIEEMSQAMVRGVVDESGEQFVAYFLPSEETVVKLREDAAKNRPYDEDHEYEYTMAREYNWNVKSKSNKEYRENFFFIERPNGVFYNELETRVHLSKRRQKNDENSITTKLTIQHVPINEKELSLYKCREKQLQPYEEQEEANAEETAKITMNAAKGSAKKMVTKNKINNDNDSRKDKLKNNNTGQDSDVFDVNEEQDFTTHSKQQSNGETVNNNKQMYKKSQQSVSISKANSESSITDNSNQESNRDS